MLSDDPGTQVRCFPGLPAQETPGRAKGTGAGGGRKQGRGPHVLTTVHTWVGEVSGQPPSPWDQDARVCRNTGGGGTSLVAQWLRILLPMQGTRVRALVREDPTCRGATKLTSHSY